MPILKFVFLAPSTSDCVPDSLVRLCYLRNVLSHLRFGRATALGSTRKRRRTLSQEESKRAKRDQPNAREIREQLRKDSFRTFKLIINKTVKCQK